MRPLLKGDSRRFDAIDLHQNCDTDNILYFTICKIKQHSLPRGKASIITHYIKLNACFYQTKEQIYFLLTNILEPTELMSDIENEKLVKQINNTIPIA